MHNIKSNGDTTNPLLLNDKSDTANHKFVIPGYASGVLTPNDTLKRSTDNQNVNENIFFGEHHEGVPIEIPAPAVYITFPYNPDKPDKPIPESTVTNAFPNGPIVITEDVQFAERPSDGLLPPKETSLVDVYYYTNENKKEDGLQLNIKPSQTNLPPKVNDFGAFGAGNLPNSQQPQINLQPPTFQFGAQTTKIPFTRFQQPAGSIPSINAQTIDQSGTGKYTGGVLGIHKLKKFCRSFFNIYFIILGGQPSASSFQNTNAIQPANYNALQNLPLSNEPNRYAGTFGGSGSNNVQATPTSLPAGGNLFNNKSAPGRYSGSFGGSSGILTPGSDATSTTISNKQPITQELTQLPVLNSEISAPIKPSFTADKYSGLFGGSPGILKPNDTH